MRNDAEWLNFVAKRIINDVSYPERINVNTFAKLCSAYFAKEINNVQFKKAIKDMEYASNIS